MGNANGREQSTPGAPAAGGRADVDAQSPAISSVNSETSNVVSSDSMGNTPPHSPGKFRSPILFAPQVNISLFFHHIFISCELGLCQFLFFFIFLLLFFGCSWDLIHSMIRRLLLGSIVWLRLGFAGNFFTKIAVLQWL